MREGGCAAVPGLTLTRARGIDRAPVFIRLLQLWRVSSSQQRITPEGVRLNEAGGPQQRFANMHCGGEFVPDGGERVQR
jgi:hypothetical protein